ncbi:MAG: GntR family transcriptional regulator [Deltaproteobacteria bacterium]|nr:GntR family transcriptional regulator [Deltaproteobacteria bacterium]
MFEKIKQNRMYESIVTQILEAMFRGDLQADDKLPSEKELGEIFGVSRVTVREAIRSLEQFGMIEVRQGSRGGAYVKKMNLDNVVGQMGNALRMTNITFPHLATARACLEREILTEMIPSKITPEDCDRLARNIDTAEAHFRKNEGSERLHSNFEFHTLLAELTKNPIVILMHKIIVDLSVSFFENVVATTPMVEKTLNQHRQILAFLRDKNFEAAGQTCFQHIQDASANIVEKSKQQSLLVSRRT